MPDSSAISALPSEAFNQQQEIIKQSDALIEDKRKLFEKMKVNVIGGMDGNDVVVGSLTLKAQVADKNKERKATASKALIDAKASGVKLSNAEEREAYADEACKHIDDDIPAMQLAYEQSLAESEDLKNAVRLICDAQDVLDKKFWMWMQVGKSAVNTADHMHDVGIRKPDFLD